jgi:hypothetical protein
VYLFMYVHGHALTVAAAGPVSEHIVLNSSFRSQVTPGDPIGFSEQEVQGLAIP